MSVCQGQGQGQGLQKRDKEERENSEKDEGSRSGPASQTDFATVTDQLASGSSLSFLLPPFCFIVLARKQVKRMRNGVSRVNSSCLNTKNRPTQKEEKTRNYMN